MDKNPFFFQIDVENLFLRVGKKLEIHIDQKIYVLFISGCFNVFRRREIRFSFFLKKMSLFLYYLTYLVWQLRESIVYFTGRDWRNRVLTFSFLLEEQVNRVWLNAEVNTRQTKVKTQAIMPKTHFREGCGGVLKSKRLSN